jgi:hypothetical protein
MNRNDRIQIVKSAIKKAHSAEMQGKEHLQAMYYRSAITHSVVGSICIAEIIAETLAEVKYTCSECKETFASQAALSGHQKKHASKYQRSGVHVLQHNQLASSDGAVGGSKP